MQHARGLPSLLVRLAAIVAGSSGCSDHPRTSCDDYVPVDKDISVAPAVACAIAAQNGLTPANFTSSSSSRLYGQACVDACGDGVHCQLPDDYVAAYFAASSDAGAGDAGAGDAGDAGAMPACPAVAGPVKVHCTSGTCDGRRTEGIDEPRAANDAGLGAYFATVSYLEAVSVHAFARLRFELSAHGAPSELLALATRAEADEVRHAAMTKDLARRFGAEPEIPTPVYAEPRDLFAIALENAVEGCVRETYGAAVACFRAMRAEDAAVRAAMESIARDECDHADLAHRIAAWALPRLRQDERDAIREAMRETVSDLIEHVDDHLEASERAICGSPSPTERRKLVGLIDRAILSS